MPTNIQAISLLVSPLWPLSSENELHENVCSTLHLGQSICGRSKFEPTVELQEADLFSFRR